MFFLNRDHLLVMARSRAWTLSRFRSRDLDCVLFYSEFRLVSMSLSSTTALPRSDIEVVGNDTEFIVRYHDQDHVEHRRMTAVLCEHQCSWTYVCREALCVVPHVPWGLGMHFCSYRFVVLKDA